MIDVVRCFNHSTVFTPASKKQVFMNKPTFYVIATPIGNLQDLSPRALESLKNSDVVLCEDTRVTLKLLQSYGLKKTVLSYHHHSEELKVKEILNLLRAGKTLSLVSDAGTPGISDPGGRLVQEIVRVFGNEVIISPIPGPNAIIAALSISGFPADTFTYLGFPPHKKGRQTFFTTAAEIETTFVYFESTHRILKSLEELSNVIGTRPIIVGRELTKLHETIYRGVAADVLAQLKTTSIKGEFVVVVAPLSFAKKQIK